MSRYFYRVKDTKGRIYENYISASNIADAAIRLEHRGFVVLEIKEKITPDNNYYDFKERKLSVLTLQEKREFFNSFYYLYKSGLSITEIFNSICSSTKNIQVKNLCRHVLKGVEKGKSLKESMEQCSNSLGYAYSMLIAAGEEAGKLEENLSSIIKNITKQEKIKSNLTSSLTHPVLTFFFAIITGLIFKFFVIEIFTLQAAGNTHINIIEIAFWAFIKILIIFLIIFGCLFFVYINKNLINKIINFILNIRIFGNLIRDYYFSNFFSVMAMAYDSGISAAKSIMLANSVIKIPEINRKIKKSEIMTEKGCEIATALGVSGVFSDFAISQISAGEKSGELDKMLRNVAFDYENRLNTSINVMLKLVEPFMLVIIGIFAAFILIKGYKAYYASIFSML